MGLSVKIPGSCGELVQGMIDDKYDILCVSLVPGAGKSTIEKFFHSAVAGWFPKDYSVAPLVGAWIEII